MKESKAQLSKKAQKEKIAAAVTAAQKCINSELFSEYKVSFLDAKEVMIQRMLQYTEQDPVKYAFGIQAMANELNVLGLLLNGAERDAKRSAE